MPKKKPDAPKNPLEPTDKELIALELETQSLALQMVDRYIQVPGHIMMGALAYCMASLIVDSDNYVSLSEQLAGKLCTDEEKYHFIVEDITSRVKQLRAFKQSVVTTLPADVQ